MTPLGGPSLLSGMLGGAMAVAVVQTVFYIAVGFVVGADFEAGLIGVPLLFALSLTICFAFSCIGTFTALRVGSSEAMQSMFPVFFVFLFFSSMAMPRNLIEQDWFRLVATINPLSYLIEGIRSFYMTGYRLGGPGARVRHLRRPDRRLPQPRRREPADDAGADVSAGAASRFTGVARAVAWRSIHNFVTNPALLVPSMIFPLFFFGAFAGGLSGIDQSPGFDYPNGYTAFEFGFVLMQASAFGGVFTGFGIARDFESGFGQRLMLAAPNRLGILGGYAISGLVRALMVDALLFALALLVGMDLSSNASELLALLGLALRDQRRDRDVGGGDRSPLPLDPGRPPDADPGLPDPVPDARLRPPGPPVLVGQERRLGQPDHPVRRGIAKPDRRLLRRPPARVPLWRRPRAPVRDLGGRRHALSRDGRVDNSEGMLRFASASLGPLGAT